MSDYQLEESKIQEEFYPTMDKYLNFIQQERDLPINPFPKEYLEQFTKSKNDFLVPTIFKDKLIWEKPLKKAFLTDDVLLGVIENSGDKEKLEILEKYRSDISELTHLLGNSFIEQLSEIFYWVSPDLSVKGKSAAELDYFFSQIEEDWRDGEDLSSYWNGKFIYHPEGEQEKTLQIRGGVPPIKVVNKLIKFGVRCNFISEKEEKQYRKYIDKIGGYFSQLQIKYDLNGTLCLSLSPLDFITASDNDLNWSSCFSLKEGCNYGHSLAMLTAKNVFIAYVKLSKGYPLYPAADLENDNDQVYVSDKIMRAWVFADEEALTVDKIYPADSSSIFRKEVVTFVNELTNNYYSKENHEKMAELNLNAAWDDGPLCVSAYNPAAAEETLKRDIDFRYYPQDYMIDFASHEIFYFKNCFDGLDEGFYQPENLGFRRCDDCGSWYQEDELDENSEGDFLCQDCYEDWQEHLDPCEDDDEKEEE